MNAVIIGLLDRLETVRDKISRIGRTLDSPHMTPFGRQVGENLRNRLTREFYIVIGELRTRGVVLNENNSDILDVKDVRTRYLRQPSPRSSQQCRTLSH